MIPARLLQRLDAWFPRERCAAIAEYIGTAAFAIFVLALAALLLALTLGTVEAAIPLLLADIGSALVMGGAIWLEYRLRG